jgi:hypothetical protein
LVALSSSGVVFSAVALFRGKFSLPARIMKEACKQLGLFMRSPYHISVALSFLDLDAQMLFTRSPYHRRGGGWKCFPRSPYFPCRNYGLHSSSCDSFCDRPIISRSRSRTKGISAKGKSFLLGRPIIVGLEDERRSCKGKGVTAKGTLKMSRTERRSCLHFSMKFRPGKESRWAVGAEGGRPIILGGRG